MTAKLNPTEKIPKLRHWDKELQKFLNTIGSTEQELDLIIDKADELWHEAFKSSNWVTKQCQTIGSIRDTYITLKLVRFNSIYKPKSQRPNTAIQVSEGKK